MLERNANCLSTRALSLQSVAFDAGCRREWRVVSWAGWFHCSARCSLQNQRCCCELFDSGWSTDDFRVSKPILHWHVQSPPRITATENIYGSRKYKVGHPHENQQNPYPNRFGMHSGRTKQSLFFSGAITAVNPASWKNSLWGNEYYDNAITSQDVFCHPDKPVRNTREFAKVRCVNKHIKRTILLFAATSGSWQRGHVSQHLLASFLFCILFAI